MYCALHYMQGATLDTEALVNAILKRLLVRAVAGALGASPAARAPPPPPAAAIRDAARAIARAAGGVERGWHRAAYMRGLCQLRRAIALVPRGGPRGARMACRMAEASLLLFSGPAPDGTSDVARCRAIVCAAFRHAAQTVGDAPAVLQAAEQLAQPAPAVPAALLPLGAELRTLFQQYGDMSQLRDDAFAFPESFDGGMNAPLPSEVGAASDVSANVEDNKLTVKS